MIQKQKSTRAFIGFMVAVLLASTPMFVRAAVSATAPLKNLPVQDGGRVKPFDSFARETLMMVYGKTEYEKKPAYEVVFTWMLEPVVWTTKPILQIEDALLRQALKIDQERKLFTPNEVLSSERLSLLMQELNSKREAEQKLGPFEQSVQRLETQIFLLRAMASGHLMKVAPAGDGKGWLSVAELSESDAEKFGSVTKAFIQGLSPDSKDPKNLQDAILELQKTFAQKDAEYSGHQKLVNLEVQYNDIHPFAWAWKASLIALIFLLLVWILPKFTQRWVQAAWLFSLTALVIQVYGFAVRVNISGRPPVSNMYETVIWVAMGSLLFSMIYEAIYRWRFILAAGNAVSILCLIVADRAPTILNPSLQPLEAVLRSNFWLTTHVLTIVISYAAFFLAFALSAIGLFWSLRNRAEDSASQKQIALSVYRAIQLGVGLLGPGIILGGVWADYSWGRFWGWDPKEIWALIAFLGYLAVLHAKVAGYIREIGLFVTTMVSFCLVIMAWYGVNFVLGAGLHTYGFGAGGIEWVSGFVVLSVAYALFAGWSARENRKA